jgi:hypothetical protein
MKRLALIIVILVSSKLYAQSVVNNHLNKFVGTWRWTSGTDTVTIILSKQVATIPYTHKSSEVLTGWHHYVKNGNLIQSSLQYTGRDVNTDFDSTFVDPKITLEGINRGATTIFFYAFWDLVTHKNGNLYFELLPNSTTQATWKLRGQTVLPQDLILTKQ